MPALGVETTIPASARLQILALDRAATGIGLKPSQRVLLKDRILGYNTA
jgi:hypothetical protein